MPKSTLAFPRPPQPLFPSSSILSMELICFPLYTASSSTTSSSSCEVRSILIMRWRESDVFEATI